MIKSHHNVGGLPDYVDFKEIIEPLRDLFKDEVRKAGLEMGIPEHLVFRQPFPGPGLGIRIIGDCLLYTSLGEENVKILRKTLNWPCEEPFKIPDEVYDFYKELASQGEEKETVWNAMMEEYAREYPDLKAELERWFDEDREDNLIEDVDFWKREGKAEATRSISGCLLYTSRCV